jgi:hypothetical protein
MTNELDVYCVNIFDTRTKKLIGLEASAIADLPRRGSTARFETYWIASAFDYETNAHYTELVTIKIEKQTGTIGHDN